LIRLINTCAWIEWLVDSPTGEGVAEILPTQADWIVPTIVELELAKWFARQWNDARSDGVLAFSQMCRVVDLTTPIALRAAELCRAHRLATADAIVYATALEVGAELVTCDAGFAALTGVRHIEKARA
jgi:predicted nucleic acid-binding protein